MTPLSSEVPHYRVELDVYSGPLDLLLYLIRKSEVDIRDIPIAKVTDQYMGYLGTMRETDLDFSGEFLVMAATLLEIKARMLIPTDEEVGDEDDPRAELVRQLMEYRDFKERAATLTEMKVAQDRLFPRGMRYVRIGDQQVDDEALQEVALWDLVSAFSTILEQTVVTMAGTVREDDVPVSSYMQRVLDQLADAAEPIAFEQIFRGSRTRLQLIGIFLALLELARLRQIRVFQSFRFGPIRIALSEPEPEPAEEPTPEPVDRAPEPEVIPEEESALAPTPDGETTPEEESASPVAEAVERTEEPEVTREEESALAPTPDGEAAPEEGNAAPPTPEATEGTEAPSAEDPNNYLAGAAEVLDPPADPGDPEPPPREKPG